ncbi:hypothetical protein [Epilithonimonas sp.]|uniref:hypothetical protein n=1 Tax=Epilithonimonas sp. TaxID=2894511 RepID=UPI00289F2F33|nr:hypothetical protein [Epilithonimonas sp.]
MKKNKRYEWIARPACFVCLAENFFCRPNVKGKQNKGLRPNKKASEKSEAYKLYVAPTLKGAFLSILQP